MRQRKADRWDLLVHKLVRQQDDDSYVHGSVVAQLLRREHRAVLQCIQRAQADYIDILKRRAQ